MTSLVYDSLAPRATALTPEQLEAIAARVTAAGASLAQARAVPDEVMALVRELPGLLHADDPGRAFGGTDPYLAEAVYAAVASAAVSALEDGPARRRGVRLGLERVRQALRDVLDDAPVAED